MKKKYLYLCLILCLLVITGCGKIPKLQNGEELVASIDGKEISVEELYKELKKRQGTTIVVDIIDNYIADKEIENSKAIEEKADADIEMYRYSYESSGQNFEYVLLNAGFESVEDFKKYLVTNYKKEEVLKKYIKAEISDKEINEYYEKEIFGEMTVRHILITPDSSELDKDKAEKDALNKAKEIIEKIKNGEKFEDLAKEHSDDTGTKSNGGLFEKFKKSNTDPDFWKASYELKDGEYTLEPVKSQYGYHIILKVSSEPKPNLELVKNEILDSITNEKINSEENFAMKMWAKIREKYNFKIIDSDIKKIYETTIENINKN